MENKKREELIRQALAVKQYAYVPYSGYRVGAAVLTKEGKIYSGCNIENASYGLSNCAERTALFKAISEGSQSFAGLAVAVDGKLPASPCGACRQVIREFMDDSTEIILLNEEGRATETTIKKLLPNAFTNANM